MAMLNYQRVTVGFMMVYDISNYSIHTSNELTEDLRGPHQHHLARFE